MPQYLSTIINLLPIVIPAIVGLVLGIVFRSRARKASLHTSFIELYHSF